MSALRALPILSLLAITARADFVQEVRPLLEKHCFRCHKEGKEKGGVNLTHPNDDLGVLKEYKLWRRVVNQVQSGEMPPDDDTGFAPSHQETVLKNVRQVLARLDRHDDGQLRDPGPGQIRRLSRSEYLAVVRDLFAIDPMVLKVLSVPEDSTGSVYDNVAAALTLSPVLAEKYFVNASTLLDLMVPPADAVQAGEWEAQERAKKAKKASEKLLAGVSPDRAGAETFLRGFLRRAWRRPVSADEVGRFVTIYEAVTQSGEPFSRALAKAMKPALVSPNFIYRVEQTGGPGSASFKVNDVELASRLSFFLWSCGPDEELLGAAERGELSDPQKLGIQVKRMLADAKATALTENFLARWLRIDALDRARPSTEFFPTFKDELKKAMKSEVTSFLDKLRSEDRSVLELLRADYTYANDALAKHYGLESVTGREMTRVSLEPGQHRGGVLGMAGILALTSHTNRTSPTLRGKYILDVILGTPPNPPPANVSQIDENKKKDGKEPKTFREKLALHAEDATCAGCHRKIDPLGFGLENFDAIGAWRAASPDLDTSGELPGGVKFNGADELMKILWERRDEFARNLVAETLSYALGRKLDYFDEPQIGRITAVLKKGGYRFSDLIAGVVASYPFQYRRGAEAELAEAR